MVDSSQFQILMAEYDRIKEEQKQRIAVRDNLIYATLASLAAVIAAVLNAKGGTALLLLLPPVCVVLGWTYLVNDQKVSAAGRYVREWVRPRLTELAPGAGTVFAWEDFQRSDPRRRSRKLLQLAVDLTTFCVPGLAAVVVHIVTGPWWPALVVVSVLELAALGVLAWQIVLYADLRTSPVPG